MCFNASQYLLELLKQLGQTPMSELSAEQVQQREITSGRDAVENLTGQANCNGETTARMGFLASNGDSQR